MASQSTRYLCCHFATSGALRASHQRINVGMSAIGLSLVTFFGIKKNIVVHACCSHLPLYSTFSKNSTIYLLVSFGKSKGTVGWNLSHPTPVFALYNLDAFSKSPSFNLGSASSHSLYSSSLRGLFCILCTSSHCQCFDHSFRFASQRSNNLASSSSFSKICTPLLYIVGFVIL